MKKVAGITLMVALLGFNAYLWPTLIREVKADQKNEAGGVTAMKNSADSTQAMDLANQGPRAANVSAYPVDTSVTKTNESAVAVNKPASEQKKQPSTKAMQTAANKQPKKAANKPSSTVRQSDGPDVQISYTIEPSYIHYEETSITNVRSSYGGGSFNMPMKYNPYTGRIEEAVKIYQGGPPAPTLNKQDFGIPETVETYVPPVKKDYQRLAPQSFPGR